MQRYYDGTSAFKIEEPRYAISEDVRENIEKRKQVRVNKKAAFAKQMRAGIVCLCAFAVCLSILFTNAMIIEKASAVNDMQNQLNMLTEENNHAKLEIEKNLDLKKIEDIAINELGMKRPDKYQVVYVNVEQTDYAEVVKADSKPVATAALGAIGSGIGQFMEYIN